MSWTSSANSPRPRRSRGRGITGTTSRPSPVTCKPPPNPTRSPRRNHGNNFPTGPPSHGDPFPHPPGSAGITGTLPTPSPRHMGLRPTPPGHPSQRALRETALSTPYNGLINSFSTPCQHPRSRINMSTDLSTICQQPVGRRGKVSRRRPPEGWRRRGPEGAQLCSASPAERGAGARGCSGPEVHKCSCGHAHI